MNTIFVFLSKISLSNSSCFLEKLIFLSMATEKIPTLLVLIFVGTYFRALRKITTFAGTNFRGY